MQEFKFEIWEEKFPMRKIIDKLLFWVMFIIAIIIYLITNNTIGMLFLFIAVLLSICLDMLFKPKYEFKGNILFTDDLIYLPNKKEESKYSDIQKIKIHFYARKGDLISGIRSPFIILSQGKDNKIKMFTTNGIFIFNVFLKNDYNYIQLKLLYHFLKEKGIDVEAKGFLEKMGEHPYGGQLRGNE